jgi:hypothetical protein
MLINIDQLNRAHSHVTRELDSLDLWLSRMAQVEVYLTAWNPMGFVCYGWQNYGTDGSICIPSISGPRISDWLFNRRGYTLRDVLRHEWAHALAHHHHDKVSKHSFIRAFDGDHDSDAEFDYDPEIHISEYAATNASEDFAENFMYYIKHRGEIPNKWQTPAIAKRWRYIASLQGRLH